MNFITLFSRNSTLFNALAIVTVTLFGITTLSAQTDCAEGETEITILIVSDNYPNEISWELGAYWASSQLLTFLGATVQFSVNLNGDLIATSSFINAEENLFPILPMRRF